VAGFLRRRGLVRTGEDGRGQVRCFVAGKREPGSATPATFSSSCNTEVWSKFSPHTQPPAVHGEMMIAGTR
jgi:hypothetical protein